MKKLFAHYLTIYSLVAANPLICYNMFAMKWDLDDFVLEATPISPDPWK